MGFHAIYVAGCRPDTEAEPVGRGGPQYRGLHGQGRLSGTRGGRKWMEIGPKSVENQWNSTVSWSA